MEYMYYTSEQMLLLSSLPPAVTYFCDLSWWIQELVSIMMLARTCFLVT